MVINDWNDREKIKKRKCMRIKKDMYELIGK